MDAAIERIERVNPALNAVVTPLFEEGRAAARAALPDGPFRGVPYLLKDLLASYGGVRMTWGSAFAPNYVPDHDSELVARLKRAGLIILGKTNTPELGILPTTEPRSLGPARNPWKLDWTTGGSSGGSAAAVAAGMVPMAHGNDGGGSIRIPASCCGVFGLKPTRARVPLGPDFGDVMLGLVVEHALTRSVRDSAALLDATAGPDTGDPYWAPPLARPLRQEVGADPGCLRVAFSTTGPMGEPLHPDCVEAVKDAARLCAELGHKVEEAVPKFDGSALIQAIIPLWTSSIAALIDSLAKLCGRTPGPDQFEDLTWGMYEMARQVTGVQILQAHDALQRVAREVAHFMERYDIWLAPTLAEPPVPLGTFESPAGNPLKGLLRAAEFIPFTPLCNMVGQPAMSVPLFWNREGLPIGAHFAGRFGDEATLVRLAAQLEAARPWAGRRPLVSAWNYRVKSVDAC